MTPPFLGPACQLLAANGWLAPGARICLEAPLNQPLPELPGGLEILRDKQAGQVRNLLAACGPQG